MKLVFWTPLGGVTLPAANWFLSVFLRRGTNSFNFPFSIESYAFIVVKGKENWTEKSRFGGENNVGSARKTVFRVVQFLPFAWPILCFPRTRFPFKLYKQTIIVFPVKNLGHRFKLFLLVFHIVAHENFNMSLEHASNKRQSISLFRVYKAFQISPLFPEWEFSRVANHNGNDNLGRHPPELNYVGLGIIKFW